MTPIQRLQAALWHVKYTAASLADAQVIALEALKVNPVVPASVEPAGAVLDQFEQDWLGFQLGQHEVLAWIERIRAALAASAVPVSTENVEAMIGDLLDDYKAEITCKNRNGWSRHRDPDDIRKELDERIAALCAAAPVVPPVQAGAETLVYTKADADALCGLAIAGYRYGAHIAIYELVAAKDAHEAWCANRRANPLPPDRLASFSSAGFNPRPEPEHDAIIARLNSAWGRVKVMLAASLEGPAPARIVFRDQKGIHD